VKRPFYLAREENRAEGRGIGSEIRKRSGARSTAKGGGEGRNEEREYCSLQSPPLHSLLGLEGKQAFSAKESDLKDPPGGGGRWAYSDFSDKNIRACTYGRRKLRQLAGGVHSDSERE